MSHELSARSPATFDTRLEVQASRISESHSERKFELKTDILSTHAQFHTVQHSKIFGSIHQRASKSL
eukprot:1379484-Amorphochlora_amoeboformis.AAC.2